MGWGPGGVHSPRLHYLPRSVGLWPTQRHHGVCLLHQSGSPRSAVARLLLPGPSSAHGQGPLCPLHPLCLPCEPHYTSAPKREASYQRSPSVAPGAGGDDGLGRRPRLGAWSGHMLVLSTVSAVIPTARRPESRRPADQARWGGSPGQTPGPGLHSLRPSQGHRTRRLPQPPCSACCIPGQLGRAHAPGSSAQQQQHSTGQQGGTRAVPGRVKERSL